MPMPAGWNYTYVSLWLHCPLGTLNSNLHMLLNSVSVTTTGSVLESQEVLQVVLQMHKVCRHPNNGII